MNSAARSAVPSHVEGETLLEAVCRQRKWRPEDFTRRVFWRATYLPGCLIAVLVGVSADRFAPDRALISYCGRLTSLREIDAELAEFARFQNRGLLRRWCQVRVSGRRLRKIAAQHLPP